METPALLKITLRNIYQGIHRIKHSWRQSFLLKLVCQGLLWLPVLLSPCSFPTDQLPVQMFLFVSPQRRQLHFSCKQLHFLFCGCESWNIDLLMLPSKGVINSRVPDNHVLFQRHQGSGGRLLPHSLLVQGFSVSSPDESSAE